MNYDEELSLQQCKLREIDYPYREYNQQLHHQYIVPRRSSETEHPVAVDCRRRKILLLEDPRLLRKPETLEFTRYKTKVRLVGSRSEHFSDSLLYKFYKLPLSHPTVEIKIESNPYPGDPFPKGATRISEEDIPLYKKDVKTIIDFVQRCSFPFVPYSVDYSTLNNKPFSCYFEWFRKCHAQFVELLKTGNTRCGTDLSYGEYLTVKEWFRLDANLQPPFLPPKRPKIKYSTLQPHFPFTRLVSLVIGMIETKQRSNRIIASCKVCGDLAFVRHQSNPDWYHCQKTPCINKVKNCKRRGKPL